MSARDQLPDLSARVQSLEEELRRQSISYKKLLAANETKQAALIQELDKKIQRIQRAQPGSHSTSDQGKLAHTVAEHVNSVVGLKEALTWRRASLRAVWACLVVLGIGATAYYIYENTVEYYQDNVATKVSLDSSTSYPLPPLVICPPWWFDADRVRSQQGLTPAAFNYSLERAELSSKLELQTVPEKARVELAIFLKRNNFSSIIEYIKWMADSAKNMGAVPKSQPQLNCSVSYYCTACDETRFVDANVFNRVCYVFRLRPAMLNSTDALSYLSVHSMDTSGGFLDSTHDEWQLDLLPNVGLRGPFTTLKSLGVYTLKIGAQRIKKLRSCTNDRDTSDDLALQRRCFVGCLRERSAKPYSTFEAGGRPTNMMFFFDLEFYKVLRKLNESVENTTYAQSVNSTGNTDSAETDWDALMTACYETCNKSACDSTVYDLTIDSFFPAGTGASKWRSVVDIYPKHTAVSLGGIFTFEEVDTLSFSEFISNVGGTFGLFLGCTMMTLAQLILALVSYAIDGRQAGNGVESARIDIRL